jgi:WD40 repeat protein
MRGIIPKIIFLAALLTGCGTLEIYVDTTPTVKSADALPTQVQVPLSLDSTSTEIQAAMLESATEWQTIWIDGNVTFYPPAGVDQPPQTSREQVWIDQPTHMFRVLSGVGETPANLFKVCDGETILELDLGSGQSQSRPLPEFAQIAHFVPPVDPDTAFPNPTWGQIGTPLAELIFSSDRAQSRGTFRPVAVDTVAGRETLVVEWNYIENKLPSFRAWLDIETAVILKLQEFDKSGGVELQAERVVTKVVFDAPFDRGLFSLQFSELPVFSDLEGNPLSTPTQTPTSAGLIDPLGTVYFFILDSEFGSDSAKLVRLPGSCAAAQIPCPLVEEVPTPFNLEPSFAPLAWSPDGKFAVVVHPGSKNGNRHELTLFDPEQQTWQTFAEFNFIDPPLWSQDGSWLAFRVQDGYGGEEIYVVSSDGRELVHMTPGDAESSGGRYVLHGWIDDSILLHSDQPGEIGELFLMNVEDDSTEPLVDILGDKPVLVPSPDGAHIAYPEVNGQSTELKLLTLETSTSGILASFQNASIYPIVWSADSARIAFTTMRSSDPNGGQDVYIIGRDGQDMQQVYRSELGRISTIAFSPDGHYLLVQDDDVSGRHIFVVNLSNLEIELLQAANLPLDWWWLAPSWRP